MMSGTADRREGSSSRRITADKEVRSLRSRRFPVCVHSEAENE
jgi:hypothetical protein